MVLPDQSGNSGGDGTGALGQTEVLLHRLRSSLLDLESDLGDDVPAPSRIALRGHIVQLVDDVDQLLDRPPLRDRSQTIDVAALAAAIADHLQSSPSALAPRRANRRDSVGRSGKRRRSVRSSILQVDVILSAVALAIAVVVLLAWMG